jgi:8-oxo-dGTP pyrophosphatase MutT (NUDIX family)
LPGGEIDGYEDITEGLVREIAEETGLIVKRGDCRLLFTSTQWEEGKSRVRLLYDVRVALVKPDVQISWEHDRFEWLSIHQAVTALMHPEYSAGLQYAIKHELL